MAVSLIREHRTWVDVLDAENRQEFCTLSGREMKRGQYRILRLVSKYNTSHSYKGQIFSIPEFELDNAVRSLKADRHFWGRYIKNALLPEDVTRIIKEASHGLIDPELE